MTVWRQTILKHDTRTCFCSPALWSATTIPLNRYVYHNAPLSDWNGLVVTAVAVTFVLKPGGGAITFNACLLLWPWPWPDNFHIWTRTMKMYRQIENNFLGQGCGKLSYYNIHRGTGTGPRAWNLLPDYLRDPSLSSDSFSSALKTYLFTTHRNT